MFIGEIQDSLQGLPGIGPKAIKDLEGLGVTKANQLLLHFPRDYEDHSVQRDLIQGVKEDLPVNCWGTVTSHEFFHHSGKRTLKIHFTDPSDNAGTLICFGRPFLANTYPVDRQFWIFGEFAYRFGELQSSSFQLSPYHGQPPKEFGRLHPLYPLGGSLTQNQLRRATAELLRSHPSVADDYPETWREEDQIPDLYSALKSLHFPKSWKELQKARQRFIHSELTHLQWALLTPKGEETTRSAKKLDLQTMEKAKKSLPFALTGAQEKVLAEILSDLSSTTPMTRLLQGDVGAGKTLVAFLSALPLIAAGCQVALMAPTELLARQHADKAAAFLEPLGIRVAYLTGNISSKSRPYLLESLAQGEIDFILGTHALFSQDVQFQKLAYVIVDEQQRFGVEQRMALEQKGDHPDFLLMSATPIPRTLALTAYGDLDVSILDEMPPGRTPVQTHLSYQHKSQKVQNFLHGELEKGHQVYWVFPLIQESSKSDLKDATSSFHHLQTIFPQYRIGLLHSKIEEEEKTRTMADFQAGKIQILVATSVVEVGVDVPKATCMVIEHAERFGLSALHQLRGRVGRRDLPSYCFLLFPEELSEEAKSRLKVMKETNDGFEIAEEDLKLRGPGELTGNRQSGFLRLRVADLHRDRPVLIKARERVKALISDSASSPEKELLTKLFAVCPPYGQDLILQV
jgi:ATP-dependent DNA helicase RecG